MTIINGIRIKDRPVHNLPVNKELQGYARKNRKAGNLAEIVFWLQVSIPQGWPVGQSPILLPCPSGTPSKIEGEY